jgi:hypothetical protein
MFAPKPDWPDLIVSPAFIFHLFHFCFCTLAGPLLAGQFFAQIRRD